jgi:hypothetical protein
MSSCDEIRKQIFKRNRLNLLSLKDKKCYKHVRRTIESRKKMKQCKYKTNEHYIHSTIQAVVKFYLSLWAMRSMALQ